jgi:hypothetical protein
MLGAITLPLITAACQKLETPPASPDSRREIPETVDTWDRSRQCADHSDRLATRLQHQSVTSPQDAQVVMWNNHYNQKERRCYVEIAFYNSRALTQKTLLPFYRKLYDAVESLEVVGYADRPSELMRDVFCRVPAPSGDRSTIGAECSVAKKFIVERMTN